MAVHVCATDMGTADHCLIWTESQLMRARGNGRSRKLCQWRIDRLELVETQQEFQEKTTENAVKFSELLERVGAAGTEMGRDRAEAKIIEGLKQLVKSAATRVIGNELMICNRGVK